MKRTRSNHIQFLLASLDEDLEETVGYIPQIQTSANYIKQCNPRMVINHKEKPYHFKSI